MYASTFSAGVKSGTWQPEPRTYPLGESWAFRMHSATDRLMSSSLPRFRTLTGGTFPMRATLFPMTSLASARSSTLSTLKAETPDPMMSSQIPRVCPQMWVPGFFPSTSPPCRTFSVK